MNDSVIKSTYKEFDDIINEITFNSNLEKEILSDIVIFVENKAAELVKSNNIVNIPYIGKFQLDPVKLMIRKESNNIKDLRKNTTKEEFKKEIKLKVLNFKIKLKENKKINNTIKNNNKSIYRQYLDLCISESKTYATIWLHSRKFKYAEPNYELDEFYIEQYGDRY